MFQKTSDAAVANNAVRPSELIAIVGLGCRFPGGANSPEQYWSLLSEGRNAITETPTDRWNLDKFYSRGTTKPGKTNSRWGGYVDAIDHFDPQLFGISPREAAAMDPQQRLLLEVAWQALEDAGMPVEGVNGHPASVFIGISSFDYSVASLSFEDRTELGPYSNTGGSSSIAANRISYCFNLRGPSVAVDTACSSSLVALHMACESLRSGKASFALAGGVNALLLPDFYVAFSQLGVLSPDGRCKTFDARANGYVRSEGAGIVVLKPYSAALRDGDDIYCVIRSSALNQDGHTDGMTVPSQSAQQDLMRQAYESANVDPSLVSYIEAHGTGTPVGDPIEAAAIGNVIGKARDERQPCYVGSVKTNIGHLEAGAGIASVIKVALAMRHQLIPRHLNFESLNPAIRLEENGLRLPIESTPWKSIAGRRIAGINGFGYGGANAHVVIEDASLAEVSKEDLATPQRNGSTAHDSVTRFGEIGWPLPVSAQSKDQLPLVANQWANWLSQQGSPRSAAEVIGSASQQRSHLRTRRVVFGDSLETIATKLRTTDADASETSSLISAAGRQHGILFVCCGQGPQHWRMGRRLYKAGGTFQTTIDRCNREFSKLASWSLITELLRDESESRLQETSIAQPALFAIQVALAAQWKDYGVGPSAVVGHSVGEIAAAYISGALSFEDACAVAVHRGRTMDLASSRGAMIAAGITADEARQLIRGHEHSLSLAAINGPQSVTISGDANAVEQVAMRVKSLGAFCRQLAVEYAFHSPQMDPVERELKRSLRGITALAPTLPMISTVTGNPIADALTDADYWWQNVRKGVLFCPAMEIAARQGFEIAIELGPHPVLSYAINESFTEAGKPIHVIPSMHRDVDDVEAFRDAFERLYQLNAPIDWQAIAAKPKTRIRLPHYPMQRQRLWQESHESQRTRLQHDFHPLLGTRTSAPDPVWQSQLSTKIHPYLGDHIVQGNCLYPAAAMVEAALKVSLSDVHATTQPSMCVRLEDMRLHQPLALDNVRTFDLSTSYRADRERIELRVKEQGTDDWHPLATIGVSSDDRPISNHSDQDAIQSLCTESVSEARCYDYCQRLGLNYGEAFRGFVSGFRQDREAWCKIRLPDDLHDDASQYILHPALLDACFHSMIIADSHFDHRLDDLYLPHRIERIQCSRDACGLTEVHVHTRIRSKDSYEMVADLELIDASGSTVMLIEGFESRNAGGLTSSEATTEFMYCYRWEADHHPPTQTDVEQPKATPKRRWLIFADRGGLSNRLVDHQRSLGHDVFEVRLGDHFTQVSATSFQVSPKQEAGWEQLLRAIPVEWITDVVFAWGLDLPTDATTPVARDLRATDRLHSTLTADQVDQSTTISCEAPLAFVQAWHHRLEDSRAEANKPAPRFSIVTAKAQSIDERAERIRYCQTPMIGLGRVLISEFSAFRTRLIDLPGSDLNDQWVALAEELEIDDSEDEVLYREGTRHVRRFVPHSSMPLPTLTFPPTPTVEPDCRTRRRSRLTTGRTSSIDDLRYEVYYPGDLAETEVVIDIQASGLNFSDVMKALALYPGLPEGPVMLGAECCGKIVRVGDAVSDWKVGDQVIAIAKGSFGTHAVVDQSLIASQPRTLNSQQAAAIPIAFLTADYALHQCARLRAGESVLIHSASGGVGLAAIQLAQQAGLVIHATAGSAPKRDFVRSLGIESVWDSRSLAFADDIRRQTDGEGVDAILNSLPGEAIRKGLQLLKTGGRFLEIGKRDIYGDRAIDLSPFRNNLALFAIDLDQLFTTDPQRMGDNLRRIALQFDQGTLQPLPLETFDADHTRDAFRYMQQAKHIGKVVVSYRSAPSEVYPCPIRVKSDRRMEIDPCHKTPANAAIRENASQPSKGISEFFRQDKTYWVAGGLGGFGLQIARWMARRGAGNLVLSGRSTSPSVQASKTLAEIESWGTAVTLMPTDITKTHDVAKTLGRIRDELPPLCGIYHTAMVLEDHLLVDLDLDSLQRVLRPKVVGGWNLHAATLDESLVSEPLEQFVLFSSLSSVFGHAGQANYAAANAALDGLAYHRRSKGLPALVINWGHLGEVGYLAQREELGARLERQGVLSFSVEEATSCLEDLLRSQATQASVLKMDWTLWRGLGLTQQVSPRFAHLIREDATDPNQTFDLVQLRAADPPEQLRQIQQLLVTKLMSLLGLRCDQLDPSRSLLELGLDSLMAVELRNWIEKQLQMTVPISELMRDASINAISKKTAERIRTHSSDANPDDPASAPADSLFSEKADQLLASIDHMDDGQVERLLAELAGATTPPEPAS
ncbi:type I polyketide synthase [Novipirellula artificiosorum]|uniref:Phthiocerol synthesis polyketide synthase type I PpsC n=1 Tax=Novipirellula artificiosorum TaxID=2528016 RepID=A0A5C6DXR2_9BACT|nr:type I polyketide synthase [Novipirellula artificiosorum]TWU40627.1 Phthiocerol synthesis polyketide synthase type I PpsC [Novipirellula artificiosorum]